MWKKGGNYTRRLKILYILFSVLHGVVVVVAFYKYDFNARTAAAKHHVAMALTNSNARAIARH